MLRAGGGYADLDYSEISDSFLSENDNAEAVLSTLKEIDTNEDSVISSDEVNTFLDNYKNIFELYDFDETETESENQQDESGVIRDRQEIKSILSEMDYTARNNILEQLGGFGSIDYLSKSDDGTIKIYSGAESVTVYSSGKYNFSYETENQSGTKIYDTQNRVENNTYIDHTNNENIVTENYSYNDDGSYQITIENSESPEEQSVLTVSEDGEVVSLETLNKTTGEKSTDYTMPQSSSGSAVSVNSCGSLSELTGQLKALEDEKNTVQDDLNTQQNTLETTQSDKDSELSSIDSEISTGESELSSANSDVEAASAEVDTAQAEADSAQSAVDSAQSDANTKECELDTATANTESAQCAEESAACDNQEKTAAQQTAQCDSDQAQCNLSTAQGNTESAQNKANTTSAQYSTAQAETVSAYKVVNQKQKEVNAAQGEYNSAQAAASKDESAWRKFTNWVSSAWNSLQNLLAGLSKAEAEAKEKEEEEERKRAVDEEAQEKLEQRKTEQDTAQDVADAAQVVLDRATGEKEVSDQEYADAMLQLANAMTEQDNAEGEYNTAMQRYMEANNYKADADGNLVDAQGNLVDVQQVAEELETFVQGLYSNRETTETKYDSVLDATIGVINNDEGQIENLNNQISSLQTEIQEEEKRIALEEEMTAALAAELGEINSAEDSAGMVDDLSSLMGNGNSKSRKDFESKQELLEAALISGNQEDIEKAYIAIYGDQEVYVLDNKTVLSESEVNALSDEDKQKVTTRKLSEVYSSDNIEKAINNRAEESVEAKNTIELLNSGMCSANGQTISTDDITNALIAQAAELEKENYDAYNHQGILSKNIGNVNDGLGIGTSISETTSQVEHYKAMVEKLQNCSDPQQYAALYKSITGENLDISSVVNLLAYNELKKETGNSEQSSTTTTDTQTVYDLSEYVNNTVDYVNNNAGGDSSVLNLTSNSKASECIEDYKETQENAKNAVNGVITGVGSAALAAVCVGLTPFTGGASLAVGVAVGAAAGAAINTSLNAADSVYDSDDDGTLDLNYTLKEASKDALVGGLNGAVSGISSGAGELVASSIGTNAAKTAVATTAGEAAKKTVINVGSKLAGAAVEGVIDGGISSSGEYLINVAYGDEEFSADKLAETAVQGAAFGAVFNVGMSAAGQAVGGIANAGESIYYDGKINTALTEGSSGNQIADMIANKLDDSLLDSSGNVNKWSVSQLTENAKSSLEAIESLGQNSGLSSDEAMAILNNVSLENQADLPEVINKLKSNEKLFTGENGYSKENIQSFISGINDIQVDPKTGNLISVTSSDYATAQKFTFEFDSNGKFTGISNVEDISDSIIDIDDINENQAVNMLMDSSLDTSGDINTNSPEIHTQDEFLADADNTFDVIEELPDKESGKIIDADSGEIKNAELESDAGNEITDVVGDSNAQDLDNAENNAIDTDLDNNTGKEITDIDGANDTQLDVIEELSDADSGEIKNVELESDAGNEITDVVDDGNTQDLDNAENNAIDTDLDNNTGKEITDVDGANDTQLDVIEELPDADSGEIKNAELESDAGNEITDVVGDSNAQDLDNAENNAIDTDLDNNTGKEITDIDGANDTQLDVIEELPDADSGEIKNAELESGAGNEITDVDGDNNAQHLDNVGDSTADTETNLINETTEKNLLIEEGVPKNFIDSLDQNQLEKLTYESKCGRGYAVTKQRYSGISISDEEIARALKYVDPQKNISLWDTIDLCNRYSDEEIVKALKYVDPQKNIAICDTIDLCNDYSDEEIAKLIKYVDPQKYVNLDDVVNLYNNYSDEEFEKLFSRIDEKGISLKDAKKTLDLDDEEFETVGRYMINADVDYSTAKKLTNEQLQKMNTIYSQKNWKPEEIKENISKLLEDQEFYKKNLEIGDIKNELGLTTNWKLLQGDEAEKELTKLKTIRSGLKSTSVDVISSKSELPVVTDEVKVSIVKFCNGTDYNLNVSIDDTINYIGKKFQEKYLHLSSTSIIQDPQAVDALIQNTMERYVSPQKAPLARWMNIDNLEEFKNTFPDVGETYEAGRIQSYAQTLKGAEGGVTYSDRSKAKNVKFIVFPKAEETNAYAFSVVQNGSYGANEAIYSPIQKLTVLYKGPEWVEGHELYTIYMQEQ
ncbi:MAG: hypothetical protein LUG16_03380 [Candidatus Gastranaerophilales bacterium]|nr:hypothetical protein [Candidatus Gastranaerophilales bacterium]